MDLTLVSENNYFYQKLPSEVSSMCLYLAEQIATSSPLTSLSKCRLINPADRPVLMIISQAINPPDAIRKKYDTCDIGNPNIIIAAWVRSQQKLLFTLDLFLRGSRPQASNKSHGDGAPPSPPRTPYLTRVVPSLTRNLI